MCPQRARITIIIVTLCAVSGANPIPAAPGKIETDQQDAAVRTKPRPHLPAASELLDKYAQTQDKLKSFILKYEDEFTGEYDLRSLRNQSERRRGAGGYLGEVRSDGTRHYRSEKLWEKRRAYLPATKSAAQSYPRYNSYLWDGKRFFQYQRSNKTGANDRLFLTPETHKGARGENIISTNRSCVLLGYFEDSYDRAPYNFRRIDDELKQAGKMQVLQNTVSVRGSQCHVIIAQTTESKYKLWIDPQHSFHIARAEITRGGPGIEFGKPEEISLYTYLKNVRFKEFGGLWMPVEADWGYDRKLIRNCFSRADHHHKIVEFTLSPDHNLLRSFETDEIRNGTSVLIIGDRGGSYTWQDGRVVDEKGRMILDCRPKKVSGAVELSPGTRSLKHPTVTELLDKFTETQEKLQSFIIKTQVESKGIENLPSGHKKKVTAEVASEFRFDGNRSSVRFHTFRDNERSYNSRLWDGHTRFDHVRGGSEPGRVVITGERNDDREKQRISRGSLIGKTMGYYYGDDERIDTILRKAIKRGDSVSVQDKLERISGSNCYIIKALTKRGKFIIWLGPEKDYNIVKAISEKGKGDLFYNLPPLKEGEYSYFILNSVQYKTIGDTWLPQKTETQTKRKGLGGKCFGGVTKCNFTQITLNPDHDSLSSFVPDDIMNGATVYIRGVPRIKYTWQDGKVVDKDGREVDVDKLIKAESEKVKNPKPKRK
ncbi:MAG: hypothetical protein ISS79_02395 [Phycisphaerae bacterium]|nr:hypothetical protein [Phycisphaerae bacterium]